ncbi:unannotated protein [freshwater metagenome]|uniref:Unannotated protein n=1 Tax=freshwater metagenome TaxID=449393 RepID=A0A6J5ZBV1_9ZZZZ
MAKRVAAAALLTLFAVQVIPSLANVISGSSQEVSGENATPSPSATTLEQSATTPTETSAPSTSESPNPSATITYPDSQTAIPEPTYALSQDVKIRIPSKFPVDPRATSVNISPVAISGGEILLVCMSVDNAVLKLSGGDKDLLIEGDNSKNLRISGDGAAVNALLNTGRGIRLIATSKINGAVITTRATSMTAPSVDADFCAGAEKVSKSSISAMGLGLNTVKNPVGIR